MKIEYQIQLADISKVFIKDLHKTLHQLEGYQLILILINYRDEV